MADTVAPVAASAHAVAEQRIRIALLGVAMICACVEVYTRLVEVDAPAWTSAKIFARLYLSLYFGVPRLVALATERNYRTSPVRTLLFALAALSACVWIIGLLLWVDHIAVSSAALYLVLYINVPRLRAPAAPTAAAHERTD